MTITPYVLYGVYIEWSLKRNTAEYKVQGEEGSEIESNDALFALR